MEVTVKDCHCGGSAEVMSVQKNGEKKALVRCLTCGETLETTATEARAVELWNEAFSREAKEKEEAKESRPKKKAPPKVKANDSK